MFNNYILSFFDKLHDNKFYYQRWCSFCIAKGMWEHTLIKMYQATGSDAMARSSALRILLDFYLLGKVNDKFIPEIIWVKIQKPYCKFWWELLISWRPYYETQWCWKLLLWAFIRNFEPRIYTEISKLYPFRLIYIPSFPSWRILYIRFMLQYVEQAGLNFESSLLFVPI